LFIGTRWLQGHSTSLKGFAFCEFPAVSTWDALAASPQHFVEADF
jgi:hypothetical protein